MAATFLALAPDLGGTVFGPFDSSPQGPGHVGLGSDAQRCHIALAAHLGIAPVHAWVTLTQDGARWLQPVDVAAAVFLQRGGRGNFAPVQQATALGPGDVIALADPRGVRFEVQEVSAAQAAAMAQPSGPAPTLGGRRPPSAQAMAQEVQRQAMATAMTQGGVAQVAQVAYRAKSGALFQPRYIIGAAVALMGAAATGCAGLLAALQSM